MFEGLEKINIEQPIILEILAMVWLTENDLENEEWYFSELNFRGFWYDTLLWLLMRRFEYSDEIYEIFRGNNWKTYLERLRTVRDYIAWNSDLINSAVSETKSWISSII